MRQGIYCCRVCELWQYWKTYSANGKLDRRCAKCGTRHRAKLDRRPGRGGRPRAFTILESPEHRPRISIRKELQARNDRVSRIARKESRFPSLRAGGFVQGSKLLQEHEENFT